MLDSEGATYFFWLRQVLNFGRMASCAAAKQQQQQAALSRAPLALSDPLRLWQLPPGWSLHSVVWSPPATSSLTDRLAPKRLPLAGIITRNGGTTLAVVVRGTRTPGDWRISG